MVGVCADVEAMANMKKNKPRTKDKRARDFFLILIKVAFFDGNVKRKSRHCVW